MSKGVGLCQTPKNKQRREKNMKTRNQFEATQRVAGFIAIAIIAIAIIACKGDDPTDPPPEQPVAATYDLTLGDIKITLHYQKESDEVPAYITRIQNRLTAITNFASNDNDSEQAILINKLKNRGGNYSIIVVYGGTSFDEFVAIDGQTVKAHDSWLTANATTITAFQLMDALNAMLALPAIDENGVPYYGTLPNGIKIYKGDATITDTQMTTVLAIIQTSYTDGIIAGNFEADFQRIIKSIRVTLGTNIVKNGNIIEFGCDAIEAYPGTAFAMIAMGETTGW
jgi:hypothetical protein